MGTNCNKIHYEAPSVTVVEVKMGDYILQMSGFREGGGYGDEFDLDTFIL